MSRSQTAILFSRQRDKNNDNNNTNSYNNDNTINSQKKSSKLLYGQGDCCFCFYFFLTIPAGREPYKVSIKNTYKNPSERKKFKKKQRSNQLKPLTRNYQRHNRYHLLLLFSKINIVSRFRWTKKWPRVEKGGFKKLAFSIPAST